MKLPIPESELQHKCGDVVWHRTNGDTPGVVTGILFRANGSIEYEVAWQDRDLTNHVGVEITSDRPKYSASEPTEGHDV